MKDFKGYGRSGGEAAWLRDLLLLTIILVVLFFQFLGGVPLIDPDEGRYAEIPREMLERADFVTPTLNYVKYFEKPPLLYWLNAASMQLFGKTEFAARFPSALCGLLTVLATYVIARRLYDRRTALISAAILGTSAGFLLQSRIILTDMLLTFCLTAALGAFIVAAKRDERRNNRFAWYLFYFFAALAVLTKGLIGMVFPAGIIAIYLLLSGNWNILARMRLFTGTLLFLAVTAPWFIAVSLANPEFPHFFFIREHFQRFTSNVHGRNQPFWFFLPVLAGTMLPWSFFIPGAISRAWRNRHHEKGDQGLYLLLWIAVIFLFFSISSSKLVPYLLPIFPPLAILIAYRFGKAFDEQSKEFKPASIVLGLALTLLGTAVIGYTYLPQIVAMLMEAIPSQVDALRQFITNAPQLSQTATMITGLLFLLQGVITLGSGKKPARILFTLCLCSLLLEISVPRLIMPVIARSESPRELALKAKAVSSPETRMVTFGLIQGVSWYTGKRVMITGNLDELEFGSKQGDQSAWFPDKSGVLKLWNSDRHLLMFLKKRELDSLLPELHPPPRILGQSGRYLLIGNR